MKDLKRKKHLQNQSRKRDSRKLAVASGSVAGFAKAGAMIEAQNIARISRRGSQAHSALIKAARSRSKKAMAISGLLGIASTVQNARSASGVGDFLGQGFGNIVGSGLGSVAPLLGGAYALLRKNPAKKALNKDKNKKALRKAKQKGTQKGDVKFIRVRGRVVPIRRKKKV